MVIGNKTIPRMSKESTFQEARNCHEVLCQNSNIRNIISPFIFSLGQFEFTDTSREVFIAHM